MRWTCAGVTVVASLLTSLAGAQQPPAAPPPERFRRAVVLLRSGEVLEAPFFEGGRHFRLRFPEGTLELPLDDLRQVFFYAKDEGDPQGFQAALGSIDGLERFLARLPEPLAHGLLLRALLRADGRAAAEAYVATHDLTWLLGLVREGAEGTDEARHAADALKRSRYTHGLVTLSDSVQLEVDFRRRSGGGIVVSVPEGRLTLSATDVASDSVSAGIGGEKDAEKELALTRALAGPETFAQRLQGLPTAEANAELLRALLRDERTAAVAMRSGVEQLDALLRWVVRSASAPGPVELAADHLARSGKLAELEDALVDALGSDLAWRRRLGQRGFATVMATVASQTEGEEVLARWEGAVEGDRAVAALRLTVGLGDRASALLARQGDQVPDVLRLLVEARCAFDASAAVAIALAPDAPEESRLLALCAVGVSRDVRQAELLIEALGSAERDGSPPEGRLVRQFDRTLTALLGAPHVEVPRAAADWAELWTAQQDPLAAAEEALTAAGDPSRPVQERLAAVDRMGALSFLTLRGARAVARILRQETDADVLAAVLELLGRFGASGSDLSALAAVPLLEDPRLDARARASVHAGLTRIYGAALPARSDVWVGLVARHAYAPPFGPLLPPVLLGEE